MENVEKYYGAFHALKAVNLTVRTGERIVLCGPSGSGKSTLIRCINQLEQVRSGRIVVDGIELTAGPKNVEAVRRNVGMVFQQFNLFPHMTVLENCTLAPMKVSGIAKAKAEETARKYLARVRIPEQAHKYPAQLSGGQQQRVAIARAIVTRPTLLVADEPTGNLDTARTHEIMELLTRLNTELGLTIAMVTHEADVAEYAERTIRFLDGHVASDSRKLEIAQP
ncbi:amino acid ABC transporter ATP-binding protein [Mesorhizobium sp. M7A.F.Ca.MR.228.00.0.0]|nr:amino acid ABC transporter ATP-binding protein [Mesorhizobium sp. M7A.F.Ca.MR.228.00.0.0]